MRRFFVADLNVRGELQLKAEYRYEDLEKIPGAAGIIEQLATVLYRSPEEFEVEIPPSGGRMVFRWRSSSESSGVATLRCGGELVSVSLLACGADARADHLTLEAFQRHLLRELRDTEYEPAFELMEIAERPLVATINFSPPRAPEEQLITALADRCFGAAYFRYHGLA